MFFMGVGSYLSKYLHADLLDRFIAIEIAIGLVGGMSALTLEAAYSLSEYYYLAAGLVIALISTGVGLEIPLVTRIVKANSNLHDAIANILAFDYLGALLASIAFPLVLLPYLGVVKTALVIGLINLAVAFLNISVFRTKLKRVAGLTTAALLSAVALGVGLYHSFAISSLLEKFIYQDPIIFASQSPYQRIVLTKFHDDTRMFLNGNIQFSSVDEYRYHEPLVHIPLSSIPNHEKVLVLGGGDGLAAREILKYSDVQQITIVDLDREVVDLASSHRVLKELNNNSLNDPRVSLVIEDAFGFLKRDNGLYSAIIIDLPDPNDFSVGKLYSREFYEIAKKRLAADGVLVTQSSSPYFAREAFWSIHNTLADVFPEVLPYTSYVPSFGLWGFNAALKRSFDPSQIEIKVPTRYLSEEVAKRLFVLDDDIGPLPSKINRLNNQALVEYYEKSWDKWD